MITIDLTPLMEKLDQLIWAVNRCADALEKANEK